MIKRITTFLLIGVLILSTFFIRANALEMQPETEKVTKFIKDNKGKYPLAYELTLSGVKENPSKGQYGAVDNFVYLAKALRGMGLSPAAAGGLCGNAHVECFMNPVLLEGGRSMEYIMQGNGRGMGYFQWSNVSDKKAMIALANKMGKPWGDREVQLAYLKKTTFDAGAPMAPFATKRIRTYKHIYSQFKDEPFSSIDEFKKTDDAERAAVIFCGNWEICNANVGNIPKRVRAAKEYAEIIAACIDGSTSIKESKEISGKLTKIADDASLEELMLSKGVKGYQEYVTDKLATLDSLSKREQYNAAVIRGGISKGDVSERLRSVRFTLSVVGWVVFIWGFISLICWLMTRRDSLIAEKLLNILLFKRGTRSKMTLLACGLMMGIGVFALSGGLFLCIVSILNNILY